VIFYGHYHDIQLALSVTLLFIHWRIKRRNGMKYFILPTSRSAVTMTLRPLCYSVLPAGTALLGVEVLRLKLMLANISACNWYTVAASGARLYAGGCAAISETWLRLTSRCVSVTSYDTVLPMGEPYFFVIQRPALVSTLFVGSIRCVAWRGNLPASPMLLMLRENGNGEKRHDETLHLTVFLWCHACICVSALDGSFIQEAISTRPSFVDIAAQMFVTSTRQ